MGMVIVELLCGVVASLDQSVRDGKRKQETDHPSRNGLDGWDEIG
jgi:hypothetical protein